MRNFVKLLIIISIIGFIWQGIVSLTAVPSYLLPSPWDVLVILKNDYLLLGSHTVISLKVIIVGLIFGVASGIVLASFVVFFPFIRPYVNPLFVIGQSLPSFVLLPLLVVWFGYGATPKVIIITMATFFSVYLPFQESLFRLPQSIEDLVKSSQGSNIRKFLHIQLPFALPSLMSGVRLAATTAPMIVTACDWIGSSQGLGYLMMWTSGRMEMDLLFACLVILLIMSMLLSQFVSLMRHFIIYWKD